MGLKEESDKAFLDTYKEKLEYTLLKRKEMEARKKLEKNLKAMGVDPDAALKSQEEVIEMEMKKEEEKQKRKKYEHGHYLMEKVKEVIKEIREYDEFLLAMLQFRSRRDDPKGRKAYHHARLMFDDIKAMAHDVEDKFL